MTNASQGTKLHYAVVTRSRAEDLKLPNEPFEIIGRMIPSLNQGKWSYTIEYFDQVHVMCFPEEHYDFDALGDQFVAVGAYDGETCVGLALLQKQGFKYLYLYDLKVNGDYRHLGVGSGLMEVSKNIAREMGLLGIYTVAQDNNLKACQFYLKNGLEIGGVNTHVYKGTKQAEKTNIYFYEK